MLSVLSFVLFPAGHRSKAVFLTDLAVAIGTFMVFLAASVVPAYAVIPHLWFAAFWLVLSAIAFCLLRERVYSHMAMKTPRGLYIAPRDMSVTNRWALIVPFVWPVFCWLVAWYFFGWQPDPGAAMGG